jgi:hypothetical protein
MELKNTRVRLNINDLLIPKFKEDIIKELSKLNQEEKDQKLIRIIYESRFDLDISQDTLIEIVKLLIEAGADINTKGMHGNTPLIFASFADQLKLIKYLIEVGADINIKNNSGNNILMIAVNYNNKELADLLKKYGDKVN